MAQSAIQRMPTGIPSLDPILDGGVPPGSVILLLGEAGAGSYEFVFSSIINLLSEPQAPARGVATLIPPSQVRYITFTRVMDDVRLEMSRSMPASDIDALAAKIRFTDLSENYFDSSVVPDEWYCKGDIITRLQKRADHPGVLGGLATALDAAEQGSLVVVDSVTDIATQSSADPLWKNFTSLLRGLQRMAKQRNLTVYLLLTQGIIDGAREKEIADIVDAVFLFRWEETPGSRRQRVMFFEKFRGVMSHLEERDLVKFAVRITESGGFEVSNIRVVI